MARRASTVWRSGLSNIPFRALEAELRRRRGVLPRLERRRGGLLGRIAALERRIIALGGALSRVRRGRQVRVRPKNTMTLVEALARALKGKTLAVREAAKAVVRTGYRTNSANFRTMVNIALIKSGRFRRVGRGRYTTKR